MAIEMGVQIEMLEKSGTEIALEQQQPPTNCEMYNISL